MVPYVRFDEASHTYWGPGGDVYVSATQLISKFKAPFNGEYWSLYKAIEEFLVTNKRKSIWWEFQKQYVDRDRRDEGVLLSNLSRVLPEELPYVLSLQQVIKDRWNDKKDKACAKGTAYHKFREEQAYKRGSQQFGDTEIKGVTSNQYTFNLAELPDGYHTELLVYNHDYKLAGQIDCCWITSQNGKRYIDINDWKSNAAIKTENRYQRMSDPVSDLEDCNYNHYRLQLSLYSWMLEQFGYTIRNLRFTHIKSILDVNGLEQIDPETGLFLAEEIPYPFTYLRQEVTDMVNHYYQTAYATHR